MKKAHNFTCKRHRLKPLLESFFFFSHTLHPRILNSFVLALNYVFPLSNFFFIF